MTCREMDTAVAEGDSSTISNLPADAQEHLKSCQECRGLMTFLDQATDGEAPSKSELDRIVRDLTADLVPVRPLAPSRFYLMAFAGVFALVVTFGASRAGTFALSEMRPVQTGVIVCVLATGAALLAWCLVGQMAPAGRTLLRPETLAAVVIVALGLVMTCLFRAQHTTDFLGHGLDCLSAGVPFALLAAAPFWFILRRGAILAPRPAGVLVGLLSGLAGTSVLEIHCPNLDLGHILTWHLGVAVIGALSGFAVGGAAESVRWNLRRKS